MEERHVLLNVAHQARSPVRHDGAAVRVLGVFTHRQHLMSHVAEYYNDGALDMIAFPCEKWAVVLRETTGGDETAHLHKLRAAYLQQERAHEHEFRQNVSDQRTGAVGPRVWADSADAGDVTDGAGEPKKREAPGVPRDAELRMQRFAVVSILPDVDEAEPRAQQPGILVWDAFDEEASARSYIKDVLATRARDVHLDVIAMYEWGPLTNLDLSGVREEFRDETLNDIMQTRKDEAKQVRSYRELCEQRGQEPNLLDLGTTGTGEIPVPLENQAFLPNLDCAEQTENSENSAEDSTENLGPTEETDLGAAA